MARSGCVYFVWDSCAWPLAGFTVKHELVAWLKRRKDTYDDLVEMEVWRVRDGNHLDSHPTELKISDLLNG